MPRPRRTTYLATAARGTEHLLAEEVEELGAEDVTVLAGRVRFRGDIEMGWRACLFSRIAMRVLRPVLELRVPDADALYASVHELRWEEHLSTQHTFAVDASVRDNPNLTHSHFVALKVKDAIVDRMREALGARPSVNPRDPDLSIVVHLAGEQCSVSLDLSGEPLFKRGYRVRGVAAPLKETLAAALVLSADWGGRRPFVDPMCGGGTIAIEAALYAASRAPGRLRSFGFQRWPSWGQAEVKRWKEILAQADEESLPRVPGPLFASDLSEQALNAAQACAQAAKVFGQIEFRKRDVRMLPPTRPPGVVVMNPPYGERIGGAGGDLLALYRGIGERMRVLKGHDVHVLIPNDPPLLDAFGLVPVRSQELWNGPLECRLHHFHVD